MSDLILAWLEQERTLLTYAINAADDFPAGLYVERGIVEKLIVARQGELHAMKGIAE